MKMKVTYIKSAPVLLAALALTSQLAGCAAGTNDTLPMYADDGYYQNPVIAVSTPDPTAIRARDGFFYLYATEDIPNTPIYRSADLVDWELVGTAFTRESRPQWNPKGKLWAPDINYVNGKYMLYYAKSTWGGEWDCGIGVATADQPQGPFTDHGALFVSKEIKVRNSIDAEMVQYEGHNYLFWGSFHGIYGVELTADGLRVKDGATPQKVAGDFMEGTYIHHRGDYWYLFGSAGTCCDGERSTYHVIVGRSSSLFGPYLDKEGRPLLDNHYTTVLHRSDEVIGPGHNGEIFTDDEGADWMLYHGFSAKDPHKGRLVWLDRVEWIDGWPHIANNRPSTVSERPKFGNILLADPTVFFEDGTYYLYGTEGMRGHAGDGFEVYRSTDMTHWEGPCGRDDGFCLKKGSQNWGTAGFWAPQVFKHDDKYYFIYTANEQIAVATSDSPLGPFVQETPTHIPCDLRQIDPFVCFEGKKAYLYHVRLQDGNRIFVSEMSKDLHSLRESTTHPCVWAEEGWENADKAPWGVCEGPTVVKMGKTYYLFYSCNDYRHPGYAVGYATSQSPLGPWQKHGEPIIIRDVIGANGTGHGDLFQNAQGEWQYVFHTHFSPSQVSPRKTAVVTLDFDGHDFHLREGSFRYLRLGEPNRHP